MSVTAPIELLDPETSSMIVALFVPTLDPPTKTLPNPVSVMLVNEDPVFVAAPVQ